MAFSFFVNGKLNPFTKHMFWYILSEKERGYGEERVLRYYGD